MLTTLNWEKKMQNKLKFGCNSQEVVIQTSSQDNLKKIKMCYGRVDYSREGDKKYINLLTTTCDHTWSKDL